jgi:hypothetical protein
MWAILATFDGPCGLCDKRIVEDNLIVKVDDEWCHADCAENEGFEVERPEDD